MEEMNRKETAHPETDMSPIYTPPVLEIKDFHLARFRGLVASARTFAKFSEQSVELETSAKSWLYQSERALEDFDALMPQN